MNTDRHDIIVSLDESLYLKLQTFKGLFGIEGDSSALKRLAEMLLIGCCPAPRDPS